MVLRDERLRADTPSEIVASTTSAMALKSTHANSGEEEIRD